MKIKLTIPGVVATGRLVSFIAPCGSEEATCLTIDGVDYAICSATGFSVTGLQVWAEGAVVSVILNIEDAKAYVQNADTNAYLEGKFADAKVYTDELIADISSSFVEITSDEISAMFA